MKKPRREVAGARCWCGGDVFMTATYGKDIRFHCFADMLHEPVVDVELLDLEEEAS